MQKAEIVCGDYLLVLEHYAKPGDFIFLDPPYLPISEYSDFKRYTKEQFYEEDHVELAKMVMRLHEMGCSVVLTNSNHPLVHELYSPFKIDVIQTKRHISCNGKSRKGEDVIVTVPPKHKTLMKLAPQPLPQQVSCYPPTRFMGSKSKLLSQIWAIASQFEFETAVDLFSGSGIVGYVLAEALAKSTANDKPLIEEYRILCNGAPLPTDNEDVAKSVLNDLMRQMKERRIAFDISDLPLDTPTEINIARRRLESVIAQTDEIQYAQAQCNQWKEISDYMTLLIKGGGKTVYDEDNAIEVPKDETPAYLEWTLWRASLAIDHLVNMPYEVRGFKLDSDFMPVSAAGGGKGDLYCEFEDFTILTEVTMSTSSRQEAMEGEPVRRHVSDAVLKYDKPVYGMFVAVRIDTNTAETFRHGVWYAKDDVKQRLNIVPLTLAQFQKYFVAMFEADKATPQTLCELLLECEAQRDILEAPSWKQYIGELVEKKAYQLKTAV